MGVRSKKPESKVGSALLGCRRASARRSHNENKILLLLATATLLQAGEYKSTGFIEWPTTVKIGALSSVAISRSHVLVLHRGEPPLLEFDAQGNYLRGFGQGLSKVAHGLRVFSADNTSTTD